MVSHLCTKTFIARGQLAGGRIFDLTFLKAPLQYVSSDTVNYYPGHILRRGRTGPTREFIGGLVVWNSCVCAWSDKQCSFY